MAAMDAGGGVEAPWVFASEELGERFEQHRQALREEHRAREARELDECQGVLLGGKFEARRRAEERERLRVERRRARRIAKEREWFARPSGKSISSVGTAIDIKDSLLHKCVAAGVSPEEAAALAARVPTHEEIRRRREERMARLRVEAFKARPLSFASDWRVRGPVLDYGDAPSLPAAHRRRSASPSSSASCPNDRQFGRNAVARVQAKIAKRRAEIDAAGEDPAPPS